MKELFYTKLDVEKNLHFNQIVHEIEQHNDIIILNIPNKVKINHADSKGDSHIGYEYSFVTFYYQGFIFYVQAATHYPFTDENDPGLFNFIAYRRVGSACKVQITFSTEYVDISSVDAWIRHFSFSKYPALRSPQPISYDVSERIAAKITKSVRRNGGLREKEVMVTEPLFIPSETWNKEHKVVTVINPDYLNSFQFDIVTDKICG